MDDRMIHCPCCGAPVTGNTCEYCGCVIYDFADINLDGKPSYIRINTPQGIICAKVVASGNSSIDIYSESVDIASRDCVVKTINRNRLCTINLELDCILDGGNLFSIVSKDRPYKTVLDDWR